MAFADAKGRGTGAPQGVLSAQSSERQGLTILQQQFPALPQDPVYIVVQARDGGSILAPGTLEEVDRLTTWIAAQQGKALIERLRADAPAVSQGLDIRVGGLQALSLDLDTALYRNFPRTILVILATGYLLLLLMFRSVLLPLKAVLMNTLSVGATYGALVYIFQVAARPAHASPVRRLLIGRRTDRRSCRRTPVHVPWGGICRAVD